MGKVKEPWAETKDLSFYLEYIREKGIIFLLFFDRQIEELTNDIYLIANKKAFARRYPTLLNSLIDIAIKFDSAAQSCSLYETNHHPTPGCA